MSLARRHVTPHASASPGLAYPKASLTPDRRSRARRALGKELLAKAESKIRDFHHCQYPGCTVRGIGLVESMHLENAGSGGNPDGSRSNTAGCYVTGCKEHHRGARSVHSGHIEMEATTPAGGNGPIVWRRRETVPGDLVYVGTSRPHILAGAIR